MFKNFFIFACSVFFTNLTIPIVVKYAQKLNIFDQPDKRKKNKFKMVRLGGISILLGFLISIIIFDFLNQTPYSFVWQNKLILLLIIAIFLIGLFDDIFKISPWPRLVLEIVLASIAWSNNLGIYSFHFSFIDYYIQLSPIFSYLITILWIVGVVNAINWIDGIDGLAAGIIFITSIGVCFVSYKYENLNEFIFSLILSGTCLGFLKSNFPPSKILMGDGGSYILGFCISIFSITGSTQYLNTYNTYSTSIILPIFLLMIPLFDMAYVILLRIFQKKLPFYPDRNHIHHRLIDNNFDEKQTIFIIYFLSFINLYFVYLLV